MRIVLLGAPGCGKGSQGHRLSRHYKIPEISTGDLLREAVAAGTPLGRAAKAVMDAGQLVSDEIVLGVIRERLTRSDARKGFVLDGYPRNAVQAEQLDELLDQLGQPIDLAVLIDVDVDLIMQRLLGRRSCLSCGASYNIFFAPPKMDDRCDECGGRLKQRADDNEEIIGNRLRTYEMQTTPVIERYREQGRLRVVQGSAALEDVFKAVVKAIEEARPSFHSRDRSAAIRRAVVRKLLEQRELEAQPVPGEQAAAQPQGDAHKPPAAAAGAGRVAADKAPAAAGKKPAAAEKRAAPKDQAPAAKKKTAVKKKAATRKKVAVQKKVGARKKVAVQKKAATRKKTAVKKKAATRKKVTVKKKIAAKKKAVTKNKAPAKKKVLARNKPGAAKKKAAVRKKAAVKKKPASRPAAKKKVAGKKAPARKKNATRKPVAKNTTVSGRKGGRKTVRKR
jgi:adenylate kinase